VAVIAGAAYFSQIVEPFVTAQSVVTVNHRDPSLPVLEVFVFALTLAWIYVGVLNYLYYTRLAKSIKVIRAKEEELLKRIKG